jgi:hypothetical protein
MIETIVSIGGVISAFISLLAVIRVWLRSRLIRSEVLQMLVQHSDELKIKSELFSRDNNLSIEEIDELKEALNKIHSDLVLIRSEKSAAPPSAETPGDA